MQAGGLYIFASLPMAAIGPEGASRRGEPPGGSTETAIAAPGANIGAIALGIGMALEAPGAIIPSECGLPSAGMIQSSWTWLGSPGFTSEVTISAPRAGS